MKRHFNYTGRARITLNKISIKLNRETGLTKSFDAQIFLSDMSLPDDALLYVEAYHKTDLRRYTFGTVGQRTTPSTSLERFGHIENILFRVKVVDESGVNGLILAEADRIRPIDKEGEERHRRSIMPTEWDRDLGQRIWCVSFEGDTPVLEFNKRIPNIRSMAKSNPDFFFYVYPQVIREVLTYMFLIDRINDPDDPEIDWHKDWLKFTDKFYPEKPPKPVPPDDPDFNEINSDIYGWISGVVEGFCSSQTRNWREFIKLIEGGES